MRRASMPAADENIKIAFGTDGGRALCYTTAEFSSIFASIGAEVDRGRGEATYNASGEESWRH